MKNFTQDSPIPTGADNKGRSRPMRRVFIPFRRLFALCAVLSLSCCLFAQQQTTVTGLVTDGKGSPMIGASVIELGTTNGVNTDLNGRFTIRVSGPEAQLQFSFIGYQTVTLPADSPVIQQGVAMYETVASLEEIVVIGYSTVRKADLTGSVSVVKAEDINRGTAVSADELLKAKVPGLLIIPGDGGPNSSSTIRIRGAASLMASNDPLIVIDGLPISSDAAPGMANALASINPNDIESFSVLKDASATAIYGSRASNGVILITTKKGSGSRPTVSYNGSFYIKNNIKTVDVMNAGEYRDFMFDFFPEGTVNGTRVRNLIGDYKTDWQNLIYRNAFGTDHNVSVFGIHNQFLPYRVSAGYTNEKGTMVTSDFERLTMDVSLSPKFFDDHLTVNVNAKGTYNRNNYADGGAVGAAVYFDPTQSPYFRNADGSIDRSRANGYFNWYSGNAPNTQATTNPLSLLYDQYDNNDVSRVVGNVQFDYKMHFLPELRANLNLGLDFTTTDGRKSPNAGSFMALKDTDLPGYGKRNVYSNLRRDQTLEFYLAYAKEIDRHRFDVMGGYSWQHFFMSDRSTDYVNDGSGDVFNANPRNAREYYLLSFFGRANYSFDSRYLFTFTLRGDASSRFSKDNRWGVFPSAAFAWNVRNEPFMKDVRSLSELKLRLGYGSTGQQDIGDDFYSYLARYELASSPETNYYLGDGFYSPLRPLAYNPNLKWETTDTYNVGIDYGFLDQRIYGSVDFYFRKTRDLLNNVPAPLGTNFSNIIISNIGNMENKGVEFTIGAIPVQTSDWRWNVNFNATWQHTKITKLLANDSPGYFIQSTGVGFGTGGYIQMHQVGSAPNTFSTYQQVYDASGKPIQNALVDRDKNGVITEADRYNTGKNPLPDAFLGLSSTLTYRNWDFGFNCRASFGNYMYNSFYAQNSSPVSNQLNLGYLDNLPRVVRKSGFQAANATEQEYSDMFLENASFFKMDDLTLGYTFKNIRGSKTKIRTAFSVQNVFTVTNYSGLDPEIGSGVDNNIWPRPRTFTLRLNINF